MSWEVRTMRSAKSWFNPTLFWKNFARFWPIWGLYLAILVLALPVDLLMNGWDLVDRAKVGVLEFISPTGQWLGLVFSLLAATAVYSYLCNSRSVGLMHSLPIRREGLFFTNFLSGLGFMVGPNFVALALMLLAEAVRGVACVGPLVMCFFALSLMELFFFSLATLCAMCTGHILGIPGLYLVANCLAIGLFSLVNTVLSQLLYGYVYSESLYQLVLWLTPVAKLTNCLDVTTQYSDTGEILSSRFIGLGYILVYVIVGLIFIGLALALYRRRQLERAGDVITVSWLRPVFRWGVALFAALGLGEFLYYIFLEDNVANDFLPLLLVMLVCGAVGYFVAEMVLQKSFWVFHRWKGCLIFLAVVAVLAGAVEMDWLGVERRVPGESQVASVEIELPYTYPYESNANWATVTSEDSQVIQAVLALHQSVVDQRKQLEKQADNVWAEIDEQYISYDYEVASLESFTVTYHLEGGGVLRRSYQLPVYWYELDDESSITGQLEALLSMPQLLQEAYGLDEYTADQLVMVHLYSDYGGEAYYESDEEDTWAYYETASAEVDSSVWTELYQAIQEDLADGSLGGMYILQTEEAANTCYDLYMELTFQEEQKDSDGEVRTSYETVTITLTTTAQRTMSILEGTGVFDREITLRTYAEAIAAEGALYDTAVSTTGEKTVTIEIDE